MNDALYNMFYDMLKNTHGEAVATVFEQYVSDLEDTEWVEDEVEGSDFDATPEVASLRPAAPVATTGIDQGLRALATRSAVTARQYNQIGMGDRIDAALDSGDRKELVNVLKDGARMARNQGMGHIQDVATIDALS